MSCSSPASTAPPPLQIRPVDSREQHGARRLILEGLGERFGHIDETCNPDLDDITANYLAPGHLFVVGYVGHSLVATGALIFAGDNVAQMVRVSVARERRGQGIGRAVVEHLVHAAKGRDVARLIVETNHDWCDAIALYRRVGFREYDRDDVSVYLDLDILRRTEPACAIDS